MLSLFPHSSPLVRTMVLLLDNKGLTSERRWISLSMDIHRSPYAYNGPTPQTTKPISGQFDLAFHHFILVIVIWRKSSWRNGWLISFKWWIRSKPWDAINALWRSLCWWLGSGTSISTLYELGTLETRCAAGDRYREPCGDVILQRGDP